eukprot:6193811-Prymnesium_polylepis.1
MCIRDSAGDDASRILRPAEEALAQVGRRDDVDRPRRQRMAGAEPLVGQPHDCSFGIAALLTRLDDE